MNTQPKNKILIIIIGILLIANIVTLSILLMNKNSQSKFGRTDRRAQITNFLKNNVHFNQQQLDLYDTLSNRQRTGMKNVYEEMAAGRENILKQLALQSFSDSAMSTAAITITEQQKGFELNMLQNLKEIRNICTPEQQKIFDTGFYRIISKRGSGRKDNDKQ